MEDLPKYKYRAKSLEGKEYKGYEDAGSEEELYEKLKAAGLILVSSTEKKENRSDKKLKPAVLADFCRQLGTLLAAGVSLVRALNIIAQEKSLKPRIKGIYENVLRLIRQGVPLSEAMEAQGVAFPEILIYMFRSAEASGNLDKTATRMALHFEKEHRLNSKVKNAMIYPLILIVMVVVVVIFIVSYIIPQFSDVFDTMDVLPLPTRMVLGISDGIRNHWLIILAVILILVVLLSLILRIPKVRLKMDRLKLKLPVVGKLLRTIYTARFGRTLSSLYSSGLPIITALQVGKRTVGNTYIESQFEDAIRSVRAGETLAKSLALIDGFENRLSSTIMVGEETGSLDSMLDVISEALEYDSELAIAKLTTLLEPILIIVMGVIIGFIMIAVLLPIFQSYSSIENSGGEY